MKAPKALLILGLFYVQPASAHSFGKLYTLPIPLWLYLYGAAAALFLSFLVIGFLTDRPIAEQPGYILRWRGYPLSLRWRGRVIRWQVLGSDSLRRIEVLLKGLALAMLGLTIVSGLIGTQDAYYNINMTLFWIVFVLGFTYLTALVGNLYAVVNPWATLAHMLALVLTRPLPFSPKRDSTRPLTGVIAYPAGLGYVPALIFYLAFIWLELFSQVQPYALSLVLLGYTVVNLIGVWLVGEVSWFRYCELFSVFLGLIARLSPLTLDKRADVIKLELHSPCRGLSREPVDHVSLLLFILFMISSTAFDGFHDTSPWINGFWVSIYHQLTPILGSNIVQTYPTFKWLYSVYQSLGLLLSPFFYLLVYMTFLALMKAVTGTRVAVRELALQFGFSLIPIALAYHITHYYTLIATQGMRVLNLASNPFGYSWNLFGTAGEQSTPSSLDMGTVWHTQVALIVLGHMVSVYLAHSEALKLFPNRRQALLSQIPMLFLMMAYTTLGLWILSLPITSAPTG